MNYKTMYPEARKRGFYKRKEVENILGVSRSTLNRWAKCEGLLTPFKVGAANCYKVEDIDNILAKLTA